MAALTIPSRPLSSSVVFGEENQERGFLSLEGLTPGEQYRARVSRIQKTFANEGYLQPRRQVGKESAIEGEDIWDAVAIKPEGSLSSVGAAATLLAPVALDSALTIIGRGTKEVETSGLSSWFSSIQSGSDAGQSSNISKLACGAALGAALTVAAGGSYLYTVRCSSYKDFEEDLKDLSGNLFRVFKNSSSSREELSIQVELVSQRRAESSLKRLFDFRNPNEMYQFLIVQGIVCDSQGNYDQAQQIYQYALSSHPAVYRTNKHKLRHLLLYLYARSLRVSGRGDLTFEHINQIPEDSPMYFLGCIERKALERPLETFDEEGLPFDLRCPLTEQIMRVPVCHEQNGYRHYYEQEEIENWLQRNPTDPFSRTSLTLGDLQIDSERALAIKFWQLTQFRS